MGIDRNAILFLKKAQALGVNFRKTITLGRQELMVSGPACSKLFKTCLHTRPDKFADQVFYRLGADRLGTIDASPFEGCKFVHDMNSPIDESPYHPNMDFIPWGIWDVVYDGGTLEHIFNFPQAIENCFKLLSVGGHLLIDTPCNNYPGHGFYQFSPCLFWALLPLNGFTIEFMVTHRIGSARWRLEPAPGGEHRQEFISLFPTQLKIIAKKVSDIPFTIPQQPDYAARWNRDQEHTLVEPRGGTLATKIRTALHFLRRFRV